MKVGKHIIPLLIGIVFALLIGGTLAIEHAQRQCRDKEGSSQMGKELCEYKDPTFYFKGDCSTASELAKIGEKYQGLKMRESQIDDKEQEMRKDVWADFGNECANYVQQNLRR